MSQAAEVEYDVVIGLEVHAQLATKTKIFCACPTKFGMPPNTQVCPVCTGMPGVLPVLNRKTFELAMSAIVAFDGKVNRHIKFDRKNYFYPDLPKNYQISQYDMPVGTGGFVEIATGGGKTRKIALTRIHLEEDAGKLIHDQAPRASLVDFNRSGAPLIEIVSEPEIHDPEEAYQYLTNLKAVLKAVGASEVNMEKGHLRCDANISLRKNKKDPLGVKVELKNLNSFKNVRQALTYEVGRQAEALDAHEKIVQETRLWDADAAKTAPMRTKEEAHDYRYFPEPDLVAFDVDEKWVNKIREELPELPKAKRERFMKTYGLNDYDARVILEDEHVAGFYENISRGYKNHKSLANWIAGPVMAHWNEAGGDFSGLKIDEKNFTRLLKMVDDSKVSLKVAREDIFPEFVKTGKSPQEIAKAKGLAQISDTGALEGIMDKVMQDNPKVCDDFRGGKHQAIQFLVGQVMRHSKGKANPNVVTTMLKEKLSK